MLLGAGRAIETNSPRPQIAQEIHLPGTEPFALLRPEGLRYWSGSYQVLKRLFDVVFSLAALVVLFPIYSVVAVAIFLTGGFPIVFRQKRVGLSGREFEIFKFRTMVKDAEKILESRPDLMEEYRRNFKIQNDPRISKLGSFLRKTTLDELPQLLNVLKGDMSLVGPRPIVPRELEMYGDSKNVYMSMKPGCAGLWQCSGRSDLTYPERVALDVEYFERAGLRYDLWIMWRTLVSIFKRDGAA